MGTEQLERSLVMTEHASRQRARKKFWSEHDRDEYECPDCERGAERVFRFEVHHKDGNPMNNSSDNLIALCARCHVWRHHDGPTIKGLDVEEWKEGFLSLGEGGEKA